MTKKQPQYKRFRLAGNPASLKRLLLMLGFIPQVFGEAREFTPSPRDVTNERRGTLTGGQC